MRQKFAGRALDVRNVPTFPSFDSCLLGTPESTFQYPLLNDHDEFVIEPFALEECRGGRSTSSEPPRRMRPYSDAVAAAAATSSSMAAATTVTATGGEQASCCSARPLAIGVVFVSMSFALIYFLMIVPLTTPILPPTPPPFSTSSPESNRSISPTVSLLSSNVSSTTTVSTTTVDPLYQFVNERNHRLQIPLIHIPHIYEVQLKLFLPWRSNVSFGSDNFAVEGHVKMHFTSGGGSRILLHSDSEQHIGECVVRDEFDREIFVKHVGRGFTQVLDLHLAAEMIHGMNYTLDVAFRGHISLEKSQGLFASPYPNGNDTGYVVVTQLQLSEARTVFPCIDIPEVKAQYDTVIIHPTGTTAVSNMLENSTTIDGGWTTTSFHRTPPMSTYLFALFVSDYPYLEKTSSRGVRSRVYCDPAKLGAAGLITETIGPLLAFYEDYFGIPYPLEKLDVVILPVLSVTAMENWGLVTVRQAEGLYNEKMFSINQKHNVQEIIGHELAHQWFGNLVTMKWWNDLWLNEGFATMIGVKAVDYLENTTWRYRDTTAEMMCITLRSDQMDHSMPVSANKEVDIMRHLELQPAQKTIVYKKAAIIIRMIERLVEDDVFQEGLNRFLSSFTYKNADHEDLFNVLAYVHDSSSGGHLSGQNFSLTDVMDTWIRQAHFPVVHVNRKEGSIVTLRQERYIHGHSFIKRDFVWKIPIFYDDPVSGKHKVFWITDKQPVVFDMGGGLVVDPHQLTYMRLKYDDAMYSDITMKLLEDFKSIPTNSRSRLLDDTLAMAECGLMDYKVAFNLTMYMTKETKYRPFQTFSAYLDFFLPRMYSHESWPVYKEYLSFVIGKPFDRMLSEGLYTNLDHDVDAYNTREIVTNRACLIGYEPCVQLSRKLFKELRQNCSEEHQLLSEMECNQIPLYLRQYIYAAAIEYGTQEDFDFLIGKWEKEHYMMERDRIWYGMCGTNVRMNSDAMWQSLIKNRARENFKYRAVLCSKKLTNHTLLMDFLIENNERLTEELTDLDHYYTWFLAIRQISSEEQLARLNEFIAPMGPSANRWIPIRRQAEGRMRWKKSIGAQVAGNATEAVAEMKKMQIAVH